MGRVSTVVLPLGAEAAQTAVLVGAVAGRSRSTRTQAAEGSGKRRRGVDLVI
jgi:hypothetical protein